MNNNRLKRAARLAACALAISAASLICAQKATPWVGQKGVTETTAQIMARNSLLPKPELGSTPHEVREEVETGRRDRTIKPNPISPKVPQWPAPGAEIQRGGHDSGPQIVGVDFLATQLSNTPGFVPPDTMGDVGPTDIIVMVNGSIRSFNKTGGLTVLNTTTDNFFNSVRNGSGTSDPVVRYDRITQRWFLGIINVASSNNRMLLAVSNGPTINASTTWTFFFFNLQSGGGGTSDNGGFLDYPSLGVDANALYIGGNIFTGGFHGTTGFVVQKSSILGAGPIVVTAFRQLATSSGPGPYSPRGVTNFDPASTEGYFIGVDNATFGTLMIRRVSNPGSATPTISANISLTVPATTFPQDFAFSGSAALDTLDDRLFAAAIFKNKLTGVSTLWAAHSFEVDGTGTANSGGNRNGSRWYQIQNLTTTPSLVQSGTLFDSAATNPKSFWIPSVAMSGQGHMSMGASYGSAVDKAGCAVSGRLSGDPLGTTQAATLAVISTFNYNINPPRWGDYSMTVVDPTDDMTMWTFQEYCNNTNSWGVRVMQLRAPLPATPTTASPAVTQGQSNVNVTVTGTSVSGSGFFYAGAGFNPITASVSGTGVTVNSVTFTDPTHVTMNVSVSGGAATGTRNVTITNPDGQSVTGNNILTVNPANAAPVITTIVPNNATAAGPGFSLTVNGSNFTGTSVVRWNGSNRTTTFVNANQVTAAIPASDIAFVGTATVTVNDSAGTSNGVTFTINPIQLAANSLTRLLGQSISGGLPEIAASDNTYLVGAFRYDGLRTQPNLQWEIGTNSTSTTMSRLDLVVEVKANTAGLQQVIQVKNNTTGNWDTVDTSLTALTDTTRNVSITTGASNYIGAGGLILIRLNFKELSPPFSIPNVSVDYVHFTIYP